MYGETIWASGKKIIAVINIRREAEYRIIKRTLLKKFPLDNLRGRVAGMEDRTAELFSESRCYFSVAGEGFGGKCDVLIGRSFSTFAIQKFLYG